MNAPRPLTCTWSHPDRHTARVALAGDLDYDTGDNLLTDVTNVVAAHPDLRELHVDCAEVGFCDSHGLSVLLMAHRAVGHAGARLFLDERPPSLTRLLALTGILGYLTGDSGVRGDLHPLS